MSQVATSSERAFRDIAKELMESEPGLHCEFSDERGDLTIRFPKESETGFDVELRLADGVLDISTDRGWHDTVHEASAQDVVDCFGMARDMLTNRGRIRESLSNGSPYSWALEFFDGSDWVNGGKTALLFWNYFGRRSERIYSNSTLPPREGGDLIGEAKT